VVSAVRCSLEVLNEFSIPERILIEREAQWIPRTSSILIRAKSTAGVFFFSIVVQSVLENTTILLQPAFRVESFSVFVQFVLENTTIML
jgi:hypothetical protein